VIKPVDDPAAFKKLALQWASAFGVFCYLDSNNFNDPYAKFDCLIAAGVKAELVADAGSAFDQLETFREKNPGWLTGFLSYDLKNETEQLSSGNPDHLGFPGLYFFVPEYAIVIRNSQVELIGDDPEELYNSILSASGQTHEVAATPLIQTRFSRSGYVQAVNEIKRHIGRGDIYVTNFCQEFYAENAAIDPLAVFQKLNAVSPNPFSAFFKYHHKYVLCASPERFMAKRGNRLISQPIKGTAKRGANAMEDELIKRDLRAHAKEQQENVMVVDLVRNDLTRAAKPGTVVTEELFGIYSFKQVHQMISTVTCELDERVSAVNAIRAAFPMGSMTGAPKLSAMQLMERYERSKRGVYSGAVGYFSPDGDFDFNVVIRTILYDLESKYLSFQAGSAITWHADAEKEYEECLLKVQAIMEVLGSTNETSEIKLV
jgi:para-aminobenzoate synthetase component 1